MDSSTKQKSSLSSNWVLINPIINQFEERGDFCLGLLSIGSYYGIKLLFAQS